MSCNVKLRSTTTSSGSANTQNTEAFVMLHCFYVLHDVHQLLGGWQCCTVRENLLFIILLFIILLFIILLFIIYYFNLRWAELQREAKHIHELHI